MLTLNDTPIFSLMQTPRTPFWYSKTTKIVNLQINKLGHYNNKLGFFFSVLKFSNLWPSIYNNTWEFLYKKYIFFSHLAYWVSVSLMTSICKRKKAMHKWVISIKVPRPVWKVNIVLYSQSYKWGKLQTSSLMRTIFQ